MMTDRLISKSIIATNAVVSGWTGAMPAPHGLRPAAQQNVSRDGYRDKRHDAHHDNHKARG
jgi:hypothetical protein